MVPTYFNNISFFFFLFFYNHFWQSFSTIIYGNDLKICLFLSHNIMKRGRGRPRKAGYNRSQLIRLRNQYNKIKPSGVVKTTGTTVFPKRLLAKLKYSDNIQLAIVSASGLTDYRFNLNGLYDPDSSGTGHQPYGFDTTIGLYSRYRVYRCDWLITMPASVTDYYTCTVVPVNGSSTFSTSPVSRVAELPYSVTRNVSPNGNSVTFKGSIYLPKLNGCKQSEYMDDDRFTGTSGANPAEVMILHVCCNSETSSMTIYPNVELTYHAEFLDLNVQSQS